MRALIFLALLGSPWAAADDVSRIVGGSDASIESFPFMANMKYGWAGVAFTQICGGTLITTSAVLSAAHCFEDYPPSQWRAFLGTSSRSTGGSEFQVSRFTIHPSYNALSTLDGDVAIVHLTQNVPLSQNINTAVIASAISELFAGLSVTSIGWGHTQYGGEPSEQLQQVSMNIVDQELCVQQYAALKTQPQFASWPDVTPNMACAGAFNVGGKAACVGDAGGPVIFLGNPNIVVGINSWGYRCGEPLYPNVIVRLPNYTQWIIANAN